MDIGDDHADADEEEEWSPLYCLPKATLTPSGLIELDTTDNEILLLRRSSTIEFRHVGPTPMGPRPRALPSTSIWKNRTTSTDNQVLLLDLTITTHRFILSHTKKKKKRRNTTNTNTDTDTNTSSIDARFVHLSNIKRKTITGKGGPSLLSPQATYKIAFQTHTYDELQLIFRSSSSASSTSPREDRDASLLELRTALERKRWEVAARLAEKKLQQTVSFNTSTETQHKVGLDRLLAKQHVRHQVNSQLAEEALNTTDTPDQLLTEAAELLKVIQKYTILIHNYELKKENNNINTNDDGTTTSSTADTATNKLKGLLSDMGMTSALTQSQMSSTKSSALSWKSKGSSNSNSSVNREYYELTARQVADFLIPKLRRGMDDGTGSSVGGMMSLTDVYCLYNRARGTNLLSPEDLRQACSLLNELNIGLCQRIFPSGITVVQLQDYTLASSNNNNNASSSSNNNTIQQTILNACPCTALEASHVLKLSPLLATEQLEEAERLGWLCRDISCISSTSSLTTITFYPNKFVQFVEQQQQQGGGG